MYSLICVVIWRNELKTIDVSNCSDNELIELAAVAIGHDSICTWNNNVYSYYSGKIFDPLMSWNTAMEIVCTLGLTCSVGTPKYENNSDVFVATAGLSSGKVYIIGECSYWLFTEVEYTNKNDEATAMRRAITIVAAKIGKIKRESNINSSFSIQP